MVGILLISGARVDWCLVGRGSEGGGRFCVEDG